MLLTFPLHARLNILHSLELFNVAMFANQLIAVSPGSMLAMMYN